jgi:hypothetical protein
MHVFDRPSLRADETSRKISRYFVVDALRRNFTAAIEGIYKKAHADLPVMPQIEVLAP